MIRPTLTSACFWNILLPLFLSGLGLAQVASNNSINDVEVCELLQHPELFDAQAVRFRGQLNFEFEGDHVNDDSCGLPILHTGIWWDYGGENVAALAQEAKRIRAMISPVSRDAQFELFEARAHDHRKQRPDGEPCDSHRACANYDVVATFTGRFFAGKMMPGRTRRGGYGHMGCCHLFVVEQVSDVDATRTPVPVDDAKFSCENETWQSEYILQTPPGIEAHLAANKQFLADQMRSRGDESLVETMKRELSPFADATGSMTWSSPDLLTTYKVRFPRQSHPKKIKKQPTTQPLAPVMVEVGREHCRQLDN